MKATHKIIHLHEEDAYALDNLDGSTGIFKPNRGNYHKGYDSGWFEFIPKRKEFTIDAYFHAVKIELIKK